MERLCRGAIRPRAEYAFHEAPTTAPLTAQLNAQVRDNGRILDNFLIKLGGSDILSIEADLGAIIPNPIFKGWTYHSQVWPRDIVIRTNITTGIWWDIAAAVACREASIEDADGAIIPAAEFIRMLSSADDDDADATAAFRWGLCLSDGGKPTLQLQSLPEAATVLCGRPALKK